jgi:hemolysin III
MTGSMWLAALMGVAVKLAYPRRYQLGSTAIYLVMGWAVIMFMQPLVVTLDRPILILVVSGGVLYTVGACVHHWRRLPFHDAIWHSLVVGAAGLHYAAIVYGIVLPAHRHREPSNWAEGEDGRFRRKLADGLHGLRALQVYRNEEV